MPAATATSPRTPPAATSSPPPVPAAGAGASPRLPQATAWDDDPYSHPPPRAAASCPRRLASLPTAAAVSVAAFVFAAATALVMLALVVAASGHYGITMPVRSAAAVLAGAGFACADAAAVLMLVLWCGGRLQPAAAAVVWTLALVSVVSGAGALGALVPIAGGALAIRLGAGGAVRRDPRPVLGLLAAAGTLSIVAGAIAPATHAHRPASSAAVPAALDPLPPSVTASPSPATTPTRPAAGPATPLSATDVAAGTQLVRNFYSALDARRFAAAWAILSPAVHARFGGFDAWRAGYGKTISSRPEINRVSPAPGGALLVRLTLVATDRTDCGPRTARFAVRWELVRRRTSWGAVSLEGTPLGSVGRACG